MTIATLIRVKVGATEAHSVIATMDHRGEDYRYLRQALNAEGHPYTIIEEAVGSRDYCIACFEAEHVIRYDR